ncbi:hypothetical protein GDO78_003276 [Eleutherodactylus coqui]|uniref:Uncharacterized protein n=1 Tax=Eleutherodactylus coqui TaxID=57060 RepID=A0A8J6K0W9_ELECQ|nr:hypothetical protein GDO78_003276 [Eleutherodactylus coqui]
MVKSTSKTCDGPLAPPTQRLGVLQLFAGAAAPPSPCNTQSVSLHPESTARNNILNYLSCNNGLKSQHAFVHYLPRYKTRKAQTLGVQGQRCKI